jgi:hypothetical protein
MTTSSCCKWPTSALIVVLGILNVGCVAQHGRDFGHWAGAADYVPLIRITMADDKKALTANDTILLIPPLGAMDQKTKEAFQQDLLREAQRFLRPRVVGVKLNGDLTKYVTEENLSPTPGIIDGQEAARLGRLMNASHVLCVWVSRSRVYPPQDLTAYFVLVNSETGRVVGEMNANFNAEEQRVVVALAEYLQSRRAREYDRTSLEIMLRSPAEYRGFVASHCIRAVAKEMCR